MPPYNHRFKSTFLAGIPPLTYAGVLGGLVLVVFAGMALIQVKSWLVASFFFLGGLGLIVLGIIEFARKDMVRFMPSIRAGRQDMKARRLELGK